MGVIYSIPLCSRGEAAKAGDDAIVDDNNNQPMPSMHQVVARQPTSLSNDNVSIDEDENRPEATSTPKSQRRNGGPNPILDAGALIAAAEQNIRDRRSPSSSIDSEGHIDEDDLGAEASRSDSGLEQSSSDELELGPPTAHLHDHGPPSLAQMLVAEEQGEERPFSAAGNHPEDEGINEETLDVTIPLENHETCEEDNNDDDVPDPVERPPEPTVPDERVDSSSSNESSPAPKDDEVNYKVASSGLGRKTGANDTTSAISNLLSEIVGDRPYEHHDHQDSNQVLRFSR